MKDLATRIGQLMEQRGWTAYKLAEKAGLKDTTVYSLFDKKKCNPTFATLVAIADAFEITLSELFVEEIKDPNSFMISQKYDALSDKSKEIIDFLLKKLD
ncbi:MAG: helix-turn-helix transcriptional regulator [Bacilli bacterium]|nr:helix-turn-helix transcriptional regulator [Bacilli bacterium]